LQSKNEKGKDDDDDEDEQATGGQAALIATVLKVRILLVFQSQVCPDPLLLLSGQESRTEHLTAGFMSNVREARHVMARLSRELTAQALSADSYKVRLLWLVFGNLVLQLCPAFHFDMY
jgi:hypothetical protein